MPRDVDLTARFEARPPSAPAAKLSDAQVAQMYGPQRFEAALELAIGKLGGKAREAAAALTQNKTAIAAGLAFWAGSHIFGLGWLLDLAMALGLGVTGMTASYKLLRAGLILRSATTVREIDAAADYLADAIMLVGVELIMAVAQQSAAKAAQVARGVFEPAAATSKAMGMTLRERTALRAAAMKTGNVIAVRVPKGSRVPHAGGEFIPKPLWVHANSDVETGLVVARTRAQVQEALQNGYYVVQRDAKGGLAALNQHDELLVVGEKRNWEFVEGLIIDPDAALPLIADLDLFDIFALDDTAEVVTVASEGGRRMKDITNPAIDRVIDTLNFYLGGRRPPVQHGTWVGAQLPPGEAGPVAFFWPCGSYVVLPPSRISAVYKTLGRRVTHVHR